MVGPKGERAGAIELKLANKHEENQRQNSPAKPLPIHEDSCDSWLNNLTFIHNELAIIVF